MLVMAFVWARIYAAKLCKPLVEIQGWHPDFPTEI